MIYGGNFFQISLKTNSIHDNIEKFFIKKIMVETFLSRERRKKERKRITIESLFDGN